MGVLTFRIFLVIGLLFSNLLRANPHTNIDRKLKISGYGRNNVFRDLRTPIFVSDDGRQFKLRFKSRLLWNQWEELTQYGRIQLTINGILKNKEFISVMGVDPIYEIAEMRPAVLNSLRSDAQFAWHQIQSRMLSQIESGSQPTSTLPVTMLGHQVRLEIVSTKNKHFLNSLIVIKNLINTEMSATLVPLYTQMIGEVVALADTSGMREYRQSLSTYDVCATCLE